MLRPCTSSCVSGSLSIREPNACTAAAVMHCPSAAHLRVRAARIPPTQLSARHDSPAGICNVSQHSLIHSQHCSAQHGICTRFQLQIFVARSKRPCSSDSRQQRLSRRMKHTPASRAADSADTGSDSSSGDGTSAAPWQDGSVASVQLGMPRRSLQVTFTCDKCGARSERMVNPVAWDKGMVIAQCSGCKAWHKLRDAGNIVLEVRYTDKDADNGSK